MDLFGNRHLFSFTYHGRPFTDSLCSVSVSPDGAGERRVYMFTDGLRVTNIVTFYPAYGAYAWVNVLENTGDAPTALIEDLRDCDISLPMAHEEKPRWTAFRPDPAEHTNLLVPRGSNLSDGEFDYRRPVENSFDAANLLLPGSRRVFGAAGGRSSHGDAPFFNVHRQGRGYMIACGWTGQWQAEFKRTEDSVTVRFGMEHTRFRLLPGEKLRVCSAVIMPYEAELAQSFNLWRRFVKEHFSLVGQPGRAAGLPLSVMVWGGMESAEMLRRLQVLEAHRVPFDTVWIDAGWYGSSAVPCPDEFEGDWGNYTGDWRVNPHIHPDGLRDVAAAVHAAGKKFLLWAEPERVRADTPIAKEHPEYFFAPVSPADKNLLLDLGNESAWQYCFETLCGLIEDLKLDWYRQDFNMDPLPVWRTNDAPEREGISEIRHICGLYRLWDALLARFPHLMIDNCASGGRRIDMETLRRSVPLWRSDRQCPESCPPEISQAQALTFAEWLSFSGTGAPGTADLYGLRSSYAPAMGIRCAYAQSRPFSADADEVRRQCEEYKRLQPYFTQDVYTPVTPSADADVWSAQQYYRPADGSGVLLVFRRKASPYETACFPLQGLSAERTYEITDLDTGERIRFSGAQLREKGLPVHISEQPGARIFLYRTVE